MTDEHGNEIYYRTIRRQCDDPVSNFKRIRTKWTKPVKLENFTDKDTELPMQKLTMQNGDEHFSLNMPCATVNGTPKHLRRILGLTMTDFRDADEIEITIKKRKK